MSALPENSRSSSPLFIDFDPHSGHVTSPKDSEGKIIPLHERVPGMGILWLLEAKHIPHEVAGVAVDFHQPVLEGLEKVIKAMDSEPNQLPPIA
ncbi:MAG: hypothetical protein JWO96_811 [Candidatus Saccharibacteria bacterium]|nr:hypothetical protein [Candidatus Saccharibacteria bacterium]